MGSIPIARIYVDCWLVSAEMSDAVEGGSNYGFFVNYTSSNYISVLQSQRLDQSLQLPPLPH